MTARAADETTRSVTETEQQFSQLVVRVARGETRVIVEESGSPVAAIISADEYRRFTRQQQRDEAERAELFEMLTQFGQAFAGIPEDELEREVANALAEVRAEMRAERRAAEAP